jgi:hypothetical protein
MMTKVRNLYKNQSVELQLSVNFYGTASGNSLSRGLRFHSYVVIKLTFKCINVNKVDVQENILHNKCMRQPFTKFQSTCLCKFVQFIQTV